MWPSQSRPPSIRYPFTKPNSSLQALPEIPDTSYGGRIQRQQTVFRTDTQNRVAIVHEEPVKHVEEKEEEGQEERTIHGIRWILILFVIFSTMFLFALDNTIVANIQPAIIEDFGEVEKLAWISVSFTLAAASTNLFWGRLFSQYDCKHCYIVSVTLFEFGSALCGAAQGMDMLIAGRVIAGFGAQGLYMGAMTFVGALTTSQERPFYVGIAGMVWGLGTVLGPVIGGVFSTSSATWRWSFYINLCIGGAFAPVYFFLIPSVELYDEGISRMERTKQIDYLGSFLLSASICLGVSGIVLGGVEFPWDSVKVIACFIACAITAGLLVVQQYWTVFTTVEQRIVPTGLNASMELVVLCIQASFSGGVAFIPIYFLPLYFQFTRGSSPTETALEFLPLVMFIVFSALFSGGMATRINRYGPWFVVAGACAIPGAAIMYKVKTDTADAVIYGAQVLLGIGSGLVMQLPFSIVQLKASPKQVALVNGVVTQFQVGGLALFLAVANSVFLNVALENLAKALPALGDEEIKGLITGTTGGVLQSLAPEQAMLALDTVVGALSDTYAIVIGLGAVDFITSFFVLKASMRPETDNKNL